jgi:hypothetical protein
MMGVALSQNLCSTPEPHSNLAWAMLANLCVGLMGTIHLYGVSPELFLTFAKRKMTIQFPN